MRKLWVVVRALFDYRPQVCLSGKQRMQLAAWLLGQRVPENRVLRLCPHCLKKLGTLGCCVCKSGQEPLLFVLHLNVLQRCMARARAQARAEHNSQRPGR